MKFSVMFTFRYRLLSYSNEKKANDVKSVAHVSTATIVLAATFLEHLKTALSFPIFLKSITKIVSVVIFKVQSFF